MIMLLHICCVEVKLISFLATLVSIIIYLHCSYLIYISLYLVYKSLV